MTLKDQSTGHVPRLPHSFEDLLSIYYTLIYISKKNRKVRGKKTIKEKPTKEMFTELDECECESDSDLHPTVIEYFSGTTM